MLHVCEAGFAEVNRCSHGGRGRDKVRLADRCQIVIQAHRSARAAYQSSLPTLVDAASPSGLRLPRAQKARARRGFPTSMASSWQSLTPYSLSTATNAVVTVVKPSSSSRQRSADFGATSGSGTRHASRS